MVLRTARLLVVAGLAACRGTGEIPDTACPNCPRLDHATHASHISQAAEAVNTGGGDGVVARAIAAARPFDRVVIPAGTYREATIVIDKPLTLTGTGVTIDGSGAHTVVLVQADDVTIEGLALRNTGSSQLEERAAVYVRNGRRCTIAGNRIDAALFGVYLEKAHGCRVHNNVIRGTGATQMQTGNGIHAWYSDSIAIADNDISGQRDGVYFEFVKHGVVERNHSTSNARYGLHFMFSDDCRYEANTYTANGNGVAVMYSHRVTMQSNTFSRNQGSAAYGLLLKEINDSHVAGNRFLGNTTALHLEGASRNRIEENAFEQNGLAIRILANAQDNTLRGNRFTGNAFDVATNSRSSYSTLRGNYWDRYHGYDLDHDGVGDVPFAPVTLFSLVVEQNPASLILLRSLFVDLLDVAERVLPALTPVDLRDTAPLMTPARTTP